MTTPPPSEASLRRRLALALLACLLLALFPLSAAVSAGTVSSAAAAQDESPTATPAPEEWPDTQGTPAWMLTPLTDIPPEQQGDTPSALIFGLILVCGMGGLLVFGIGAAILMERFQRSRR